MKKKETVCATLFGVDAVLLLLMWSLHGANWPPTFGRAEITYSSTGKIFEFLVPGR